MDNSSYQRYKSLPRQYRGLATFYWVKEIQRLNGVKNVPALLKKLEWLPCRCELTYKEERSKFWNEKLLLKPVCEIEKIQNIDENFPETSRILTKPLWFYLSDLAADGHEFLDAFQEISGLRETKISIENIRKLWDESNWDGLFALLFLHENLEQIDGLLDLVNHLAFSLFCELMLAYRHTCNHQSLILLFETIESKFFTHNYQPIVSGDNKRTTSEQLSLQCSRFGQGKTSEELIEFLNGLNHLIERLVSSNKLTDDDTIKHQFIYYALEQDLAALYDEIDGRHHKAHFPTLDVILNSIH